MEGATPAGLGIRSSPEMSSHRVAGSSPPERRCLIFAPRLRVVCPTPDSWRPNFAWSCGASACCPPAGDACRCTSTRRGFFGGRARWMRPTEGGTNKRPECCMTIRDATSEYWIDGRQHRPLRRRHSGKGRAVPALVLDPNRSSLNCAYEPRQGLVSLHHPQTPLL